MRLLSASRTGSKQNKTLRLLKQLEFLVVGQALRLPVRAGLAVTRSATDAVALQFRGRDHALEKKSRILLCELGARKLAREIRIEWNPRMRTAAGRAHFREKLISLNPLLRDHDLVSVSRQSGSDIDRTLRHELAHLLAQFRAGRRRILPHGNEWRQACRDLGIADEARCHNLPFPTKAYPARFVYRCRACRKDFPRVRHVRRAVACLTCCRKHNGGDFDARFRLQLVSEFGGARAVVPLK
jgi:SprT protein